MGSTSAPKCKETGDEILAWVNTKDSPKSKETRNKILTQVNIEMIYKSLIPTFGKRTIMIINEPKVGIKLLQIISCQNL